jgi:mono/diheme cytochrome c family protein
MKKWMWVVPAALGGFLLLTPVEAQEKAVSEGARLVQERCTGCHGAGRIDQAKKDRKGWESTVDRMIGKGAKLNAQEREAMLAHLSSADRTSARPTDLR